MKRLIEFFLVFLCGSVLGCIPVQEQRVIVAPDRKVVSGPLLPEDLLDRRIDFLNKTLDKDTLSEKDRQIAANLLTTYRSAKKASSVELNEAEYRQLVRDLLNALERMDEHYFSKVEMTWDYSKAVSHFMKKRKEIFVVHRPATHPCRCRRPDQTACLLASTQIETSRSWNPRGGPGRAVAALGWLDMVPNHVQEE